jgi:CRP/FNR family transcriptional regulator
MIDRKEDLDFLQDTLSFWRELTGVQKNYLQQMVVKKHFTAGESMKGSSEHCSGLFLIKSGQVRTYIVSESGKEITLYRLFERDVCIFTASCIMKNIAFEVHIELEKETQAYLIPTPVFKKLSDESLPVQTFMNQILSSRFTEVVWIMEQALFTSFDKRLANFLMEQMVIEDSDTLTITHEKIANHLGTAREVVTRMLKYFQNIGIVSLNRGEIVIVDPNKLGKLTE